MPESIAEEVGPEAAADPVHVRIASGANTPDIPMAPAEVVKSDPDATKEKDSAEQPKFDIR